MEWTVGVTNHDTDAHEQVVSTLKSPYPEALTLRIREGRYDTVDIVWYHFHLVERARLQVAVGAPPEPLNHLHNHI